MEDYNATKKKKVLIVFDDIKADTELNKKLSPVDTELSLRERKLNISLVFISKSYFKVPKMIRINATHYFIIPNKKELQQIAFNHSSDIEVKNLMKLYKDYTKETYLFLVNKSTLSSENPLRFRKNVFQNEY